LYGHRVAQGDGTLRAFLQQHMNDGLRRAIAEQLATMFFMKGDLIAFHQGDKIRGVVACQWAFGKMRIER